MNRRTVIRLGIISSASLLGGPYVAAHHIVSKPEVEEHVRHGAFNLFPSEQLLTSKPRIHRFYKNGFKPSKDDLIMLSFEYEGEAVLMKLRAADLGKHYPITRSFRSSKGVHMLLLLNS